MVLKDMSRRVSLCTLSFMLISSFFILSEAQYIAIEYTFKYYILILTKLYTIKQKFIDISVNSGMLLMLWIANTSKVISLSTLENGVLDDFE